MKQKLDTTKSGKSTFGKVDLKQYEVNSPDELKCTHFGVCSGCSIKGNFIEKTPMLQRAKRFFTSENITMKGCESYFISCLLIFYSSRLTVHLGNITHWRTHVKLAVQPLSKWGGIKIGLYKAGTHVVEPIPNCAVHHPTINVAIEELKQHALALKIRGYEEAKNGIPAQGELRYVQLSLERSSGMHIPFRIRHCRIQSLLFSQEKYSSCWCGTQECTKTANRRSLASLRD